MPTPNGFGAAEAVPVVLLPEIEFDAADGRPADPGMGATVPWEVVPLPALVFDAADPSDAGSPSRTDE